MGSNHIWKTSSGKSPLKSHLTVSQRLDGRVSEGMERAKERDYSHNLNRVFAARPDSVGFSRSLGGERQVRSSWVTMQNEEKE